MYGDMYKSFPKNRFWFIDLGEREKHRFVVPLTYAFIGANPQP